MGVKAFLSGTDTFEEMSEGLPVDELFTSLDACDLDGDGTMEIAGGTVEGGIKIFSNRGKRWHEMDVPGLPKEGLKKIYGIYCIDLNGDGFKDIAVNYSSEDEDNGGIRVFLNASARKD